MPPLVSSKIPGAFFWWLSGSLGTLLRGERQRAGGSEAGARLPEVEFGETPRPTGRPAAACESEFTIRGFYSYTTSRNPLFAAYAGTARTLGRARFDLFAGGRGATQPAPPHGITRWEQASVVRNWKREINGREAVQIKKVAETI